MNLKDYTFGIVGLGIMGGSIARAIRSNIFSEPNSHGKILAMDLRKDSLSMAQNQGIIDKGFLPEQTNQMLCDCDFIFICLYPHKTIDFLYEHKSSFKKNAIITDISGVKNLLEKELPKIIPENTDFILGHPMAGGEKEGFANSNGEYFKNHNYILIPKPYNKPQNLEIIKSLITQMGFSRITETDTETHDNKIAFTSQLCHVIASAMVESAENPEITQFAGGSFDDFTRIAMINAPLWTELFLANKEKLLNHIHKFQQTLEEFEKSISNEDSEKLQSLLEDVREKRILMK